MEETENAKKYLTQTELAERWQCSAGTIINYRRKGIMSYLQFPECKKVLYPIEDIIEIEKNNTNRKGGEKPKAELKKVKPCASSSKNKEWRV
ncbi:MAG: hypothetical protein WA081_18400 [Desulfosalsimonadaceae bacterium]